MVKLPADPCIENRKLGYYLRGTRISLDSIAYAVKRGDSIDEILADFPSLDSRRSLEEVLAYIRAHPLKVDEYLSQQTQRWDDARKQNPPAVVEKLAQFRANKALKSA